MYVWKREHKAERLQKVWQQILWEPRLLWRPHVVDKGCLRWRAGDAAEGFQRGQGCWRSDLLAQWEQLCRSYARHVILAEKTAPTNSFNKQENGIISNIPFGIKFKPGVAESPPQSEFVKRKNVVQVGFSVLARPQLERCKWVPTSVNMTVSQTSSDTSNHGLLKLVPPSLNPTAELSYGTSSGANAQIQVTDEHFGFCHSATHIDQILLEALTQVFNKSCFAGEVLEQDKILHPHTVAGRQSALHGQPNTVSPRSLQPKAEEGWDVSGFVCSSLSPQEQLTTITHGQPINRRGY